MDLHAVDAHVPAQLGSWQPGDAWLAGGTWLFSEPQPALRRLRDLRAFGWPAITYDGERLELAATCTIAELAAWPVPPELSAGPLIRGCCESLLGSFKVWNAATVGGNICLALPAGPMTSLTAGLDATAVVWSADGGDVRELPVAELVTGERTTALAPGELLRAIRIDRPALTSRTAMRQFSLTPLGRSAALLIGRLTPGGDFTLTITASVPRPMQLRFPGVPGASELQHAIANLGLTYHDDVHGDPDWRAHLTKLLAEEIRAELAR